MRRSVTRSMFLAIPAALSACTSWSNEQPAVLLRTERNHAALQAAVAKLLQVDSMRLADDALTTANSIAIERARPRDAAGALLQGRETELPERFRLVKQDADCVLIHERTGKRQRLAGVDCRVKP